MSAAQTPYCVARLPGAHGDATFPAIMSPCAPYSGWRMSSSAYQQNPSDADAEAKFIVRACNSHDVLVAALESVTSALAGWVEIAEDHDARTSDDVALAAARAAIARAKGEFCEGNGE